MKRDSGCRSYSRPLWRLPNSINQSIYLSILLLLLLLLLLLMLLLLTLGFAFVASGALISTPMLSDAAAILY